MQDAALIDRLHCYLPGWDMPKMDPAMLTNHYAFIVDYLAEAFRYMRRQNFTELLDRSFVLGGHLNKRDDTAVRRCVAGLLKILHPDQGHTRDELAEYMELALETRRRVKEQLKKIQKGRRERRLGRSEKKTAFRLARAEPRQRSRLLVGR